MTRTELKEKAVNIDSCQCYQWYKVYYNIYLGGRKYVTFDYCMNSDENPHAIKNMAEKLNKDFIAVIEWNI